MLRRKWEKYCCHFSCMLVLPIYVCTVQRTTFQEPAISFYHEIPSSNSGHLGWWQALLSAKLSQQCRKQQLQNKKNSFVILSLEVIQVKSGMEGHASVPTTWEAEAGLSPQVQG